MPEFAHLQSKASGSNSLILLLEISSENVCLTQSEAPRESSNQNVLLLIFLIRRMHKIHSTGIVGCSLWPRHTLGSGHTLANKTNSSLLPSIS